MAAVESAVNVVNKRVIDYFAEDIWTNLADLNSEIAVQVPEINQEIRRADDTTRWELFEAEEATQLGLLPGDRFEEVEWKELKVGRNEDIPSSVEPRWRPDDHRATFTVSS